MGRGQQSFLAVTKRNPSPHKPLVGMETFNALLDLMHQRWTEVSPETEQLIQFLQSTECPRNLRKIALKKARYLLNHDAGWTNRSLSDEDTATFYDYCGFFSALAWPNSISTLKLVTGVSKKDDQTIQKMVQHVSAELVEACLLRLPSDLIVITTHGEYPNDEMLPLTDKPRPAGLGQHLFLANVIFLADTIVDNPSILKKAVAHELIHGNEVLHYFQDNKQDEISFPDLKGEHRAFLREGLCDWLANYYTTGNPLDDPVDGRYLENVLFVENHAVPYLGKTRKTIAKKMAKLLQNADSETFLQHVLRQIPSLEETLKNYVSV